MDSVAWVIIALDRPHIKRGGLHLAFEKGSPAEEMTLPERTILTTIIFLHPFYLTDVDGVQSARQRQVVFIDPLELETALKRDVQLGEEPRISARR